MKLAVIDGDSDAATSQSSHWVNTEIDARTCVLVSELLVFLCSRQENFCPSNPSLYWGATGV